ncbi:MAG TPA: hypothetical protein VJR92_08480 [Gemmatimonadaceae bacterium]|nr:hypothetical protein [Gemmatimonadaceae bacterium]
MLPARLSDQEFWKLSTDLSEPPGTFRSENLLSNETGYQMVIPSLLKGDRQNKVYMGVGPEQNYTYIAALKPKMVIIIDIRRGNLLEHLLYKSIFELSANRNEFMARLFGKKLDTKLDTNSTADALANAYWGVEGDSATYARHKAAVRDLLVTTHKFPLTPEDVEHLNWIYDQFYYFGLPITYNSSGGMGGGRGGGSMPTYADLMMSLDGQLPTPTNRGYLASEANWRVVKDLHAKNLIVPVMGDFGGPKAIRATAAWLKERGATVAAFYASNVEQYLWQDNKAYAYYESVAELPTDSSSVIIRSGGGGRGGFGGGGGGMRGPNYMCPIKDLVAANKAGRVNMYNDVFSYCTY